MKIQKYELQLVKEGQCEYSAVSSPRAVFEISKSIGLQNKAEEEFWMVCLDTKNKPIGLHMVARGDVNQAIVHPREVFKRALLNNATSIILMHNHPSGKVEPSASDVKTTERLVEAGKVLGIEVLDHIVVGEGFLSFKEEGMI